MDKINLGTANGWKTLPTQYSKHLAECGTEYETTMCYMEYEYDDNGKWEDSLAPLLTMPHVLLQGGIFQD